MTEPVTEAEVRIEAVRYLLTSGADYFGRETVETLIEAHDTIAQARADALTMTIDGKPAGMIDPEEWVKRALAAEQARADANAKIERLHGWLERVAVAHYFDGSHHANSDPDCPICTALAPFIKDENDRARQALSATPQPDSESLRVRNEAETRAIQAAADEGLLACDFTTAIDIVRRRLNIVDAQPTRTTSKQSDD